MVLLVIGATLLLTRSITRPLAALAAAAQRIGRGEPPSDVPTARADEIGELARAFVDMAAQRQAAEARTRELLDLAADAFFVADLEGRYRDVNLAACQLLGYSRDELIGKTIADLIAPEELARLAEQRAFLLESGQPAISEWSLRKKDGTVVPTEVSAKILPDGRWQAFVRDIGERKRREAAQARVLELALEHRRRLEALRESSLAISELGAASATKMPDVLQSIVDQARRLTGARYGALGIGTAPERPFAPWVWSGLSPETAERIGRMPHPRGLLGAVAAGDVSIRVARIAEHARAAGFPAHHPPMEAFLGVPVRLRERAVGNLYLANGPGEPAFTEEHQMVTELLAGHAAIAIENARLYDELHSAVRAREEMLAVVSHDLKNPLHAIGLRAQLLEKQPDPRLQAQAVSIRRAVLRMQGMIRGLLDAASLDAGRLRLDCADHALKPIVDEILDGVAPLAQDNDVRLDCGIAADVAVFVDRDRIQQVLANLVGNAVKFTRPGGVVTVAAERAPGELVVRVSDTGVGIAPAALPRIFERYFTTEAGGRGTGLGLFIAKALVEAHGGRLTVASEPGRGTTFAFTLPERSLRVEAEAR
ncbi:MAG TPA: ATP-binding protein, partial [Polyangia bacterium]